MITASGSQLSTSEWATVSALTADTSTGGETRLMYYFEASTNDVQVSIQGSVNGSNWISLNTRDLDNPDMQNDVITVLSGASAVAVICPEDESGINSCFKEYRIQIRGTSPYGTLNTDLFAK